MLRGGRARAARSGDPSAPALTRGAERSTTPAHAAETLAALPRQRSAVAAEAYAAEPRWVARPVLAGLLRFAVLAVPIAASLGCAALLTATLPQATDLGTALLWWAIVIVASTVVLFGVERLARRALPLALLLRLSLLFPDQAPKRYRVAARAWSSRRLMDTAVSGGEAPAEAATRVIALLAGLAAHDRRTRGHCERVRAYNDLLAEELGLPKPDRERLRWAALIHDVGKIDVPRRLLNKPGKPTPAEWQRLYAHPARGAALAAPLAGWLGPWAQAIVEHHERWDGTGYPRGLAGTDISFGARIVAVADAFEVMTSARPYAGAVSASAARAELATCAGTHFDPMVVRAFLTISIGRLRKAMGPVAWLTQIPFLAGMPRLEAAILGAGHQAVAGAGAVAGVVTITALGPGHEATHHHHDLPAVAQPARAAATAAARNARTPTDAGTTAAAPTPAATHRSPAATPIRPGGHGHDPARAGAEDGSGPTDTTGAPVVASGNPTHGRPAQQPTAGATPSARTDNGHRCDGNSGAGLGNGGGAKPHPQPTHGHRRSATRAERLAPGMLACDDQ